MRAFGCLLIVVVFLSSCTQEKKQEVREHVGPAVKTNNVMLNDTQMALANITTQTVSEKAIGQTTSLNGRLAVNEELTEVISSRAAGRVEKLWVKETGRIVQKGEPLYELFSEQLLTFQQEYLLAKEQYESLGKNEPRYESFLKAAERKLLLYGLSEKQIEILARSKAIQQRITFLAPAGGVVTEINAAEGQFLTEGSALFRLENLRNLWIESELYPHETSLVKVGDRIKVRISGFESMPVEARVSFLSPEYRANTQIIVMRALIQNKELKFTPGMQGQVIFTHSSHMALAIPVDAVIRDERGTHVYVQSEKNTFQPRMVTTGVEDFEQVEIIDGLKPNEIIAVSGAYLLYSELILKHGSNPMEGHAH